MYERSAIVLEKYFNNMCGFDKKINLKVIYKEYKEVIEEIKKYQAIIKEEDRIISEFDEAANEIRKIEQEQKALYKSNIKFEEERNQIFDNLDEDSLTIEKKLIKIEESLDRNNRRLGELREDFVKALTIFNEKQKERNKFSKSRREDEKNYLQTLERVEKNISLIELEVIKNLKDFISSDGEVEKQEITEIMIGNGKDEKVPFDSNVIENAVSVRCEIAKKEADCFLTIYEKIRKILVEVNNDDVKINKHDKLLKDISVKLEFLKAEKMYIFSFLDNERMTAINGQKAHKQLMLDACEKFNLDIKQFDNLYELILREIAGKASKKVYMELYDKQYLKNIQEKEKSFEKEINNIKINTGTIINSNYWRIDEIKNIYQVFQKEVSEKFEKDLSDFKLEDTEEIEEENVETDEDIFRKKLYKRDVEEDVKLKEINNDEEDYEDDDNEDDDDHYDNEEEDEEDENSEEYYDEEDDEEEDSEDYYEDDEDEDDDEYEEYYEEDDDEDYEDDFEDDEDDEDDEDNYKSEDNKDIVKSNDKEKKDKGLFGKFFKDKKD